MPLVLGVESTTRSTTVELRDSEDGRLFGSGRANHPEPTSSERACSDQDPLEWWQALVDARRDAGGGSSSALRPKSTWRSKSWVGGPTVIMRSSR